MNSIIEKLEPCPPPDGSLLFSDSQRNALTGILAILQAGKFRQGELKAVVPEMVDLLTTASRTEEELEAWANELKRWVRWYRVPAYWLTYLYQLVAKKQNSIYFLLACDLYCEAQTHFADDLALVSLETAYNTILGNRAQLGDALAVIEPLFKRKLQLYYKYYHQWSRPFDYAECNPCSEHLYSQISHAWLAQAWLAATGAEANQPTPHFDAPLLTGIIEQCQAKEFAYYRILARRFLGSIYGGQGRHDLSAEQFRLALEQARELHLDTEIGHLRRLYGLALRFFGNFGEARHQFEQAYAFEQLEPFFGYTSYWQALSARELGDTLVGLSGHAMKPLPGSSSVWAVAIENQSQLQTALRAYHDGRLFLNSHLTLQCPFPLGRAAKQQIFRSFSGNSIQAACMAKDSHAMLAEVELHGPRAATEVVTEIAAAGTTPASLASFRRNRALYNRKLNTLPGTFDEYLADIPQTNVAKRAYLETYFQLDSKLIKAQGCDEIVKQVLELRLPDTVFLLFHVDARASTIVLADMSSGAAGPFRANFGERDLLAIQQDYMRDVQNAETMPNAMAKVLARYAELLGPTLEPILPFLPGKHLKIFPRLHMNAVPLHALKLGGKYLIEHCDAISYGQTLGLWLASRSFESPQPGGVVRFVMGDDVPWYEFILPQLRQRLGSALVEEHQPSWSELVGSIATKPASDILFACHGQYNPENLFESDLNLASGKSGGRVLFEQVFEELDLRGCRSVFMGACESGLTRSTINAEYLGLPSAMLASGVRYVIGSLWKIPQHPTAVLVDRYLELLAGNQVGVCTALCTAQRELMRMARDEFANWVRALNLDAATFDSIMTDMAGLPEIPFKDPYYWAGLQVVGDV